MVTIQARFNGPERSGNGGYCCGLIAGELDHDGPRTATLRLPPPLDTPLSFEHADDTVRLLTAGGAVVGEATPGSFVRQVPPAPTAEQAAAGEAAYPGHDAHPFGHCFTCGTQRAEGDGLRIFTGPVAPGSSTTAATWTPHPEHAEGESVPLPIVWAAIDCAGGWTADFTRHPTVLGRMTAQVFRAPEPGEPCVVTGHLSARDGRKFLTDTALYSGTELLARSEQVWIEIDPSQFG
ncbi:MAG TPA: hypothetical protein VNZ66_12175 [Aeromicrobium sp.]|nr:hypothetical protein [Aeromicrobium sp.]